MKTIFDRSLIAALAVAAVALTGCDTTEVLHAHFNADSVGALPNPALPGPPEGDELWSTADGRTAMLSIVDSPLLSSKSMRFVNVPALQRLVGLTSTHIRSDAHRLYISWSGVMNPGSQPLDIFVGAPPDTERDLGLLIGGVRLHNGVVSVWMDNERIFRRESGPRGVLPIGNYTANTRHFVLITVDRSEHYNVRFIQGGRTWTSDNIRFLDIEAGATTRPTLYLEFPPAGGTQSSYDIDEVTIRAQIPAMRRG